MESKNSGRVISRIDSLYEGYFLDYASYVILERAVPEIRDGLKPVQRRILHSLKEMDDGRFHKVANVIGNTMKYHPHGDAAIGDALIKLGQNDLLVDTQGNWGDYRTGDSAAAPRYIEARLTKFALHIAFNKEITDWQMSYDGRNKEPIYLPLKFPLVLAQGAEGIAVGLSTKILPHNFIELIKASIKILEDKNFEIYPDFPTGGYIDVSDYQDGKRGGKVKVRAAIEKVDKSTLRITELPYGNTTDQLIDSILKANDKGKINIKKIVDNTAENVDVLVHLDSKTNPDMTIDALYAFTKCEDSISTNACIIQDNKPVFISVKDLLRESTLWTKELLRRELLIRERDLLEKWHFASLEKIFIENRVYREIEEAESWEEVVQIIDKEMRRYIVTPDEKVEDGDQRLPLHRPFTEEDIHRLTEIRIRRISKYNKFKAQEQLVALEEEIAEVRHHLKNLNDFAIAYFQDILKNYGKGRERKTQITTFGDIRIQQVAANNCKLYIDRKEGFVGHGLKDGEFITDCSDIDDIIVFLEDGNFSVTRIDEKQFIGKNIMHAAVWKKGDERTTYNLVYSDMDSGVTRAKRFNVKAITRDRKYDLATAAQKSKIRHFSANPNAEAEVLTIFLSPSARARKKVFDFDFSTIDIKGRSSQGNIVTKYPIRKIEISEEGKSTIGGMKVWYDEVTGQLNGRDIGRFLGEFDSSDKLIEIFKDGSYQIRTVDLNFTQKFDSSKLFSLEKWHPQQVVTAIYYDPAKSITLVKRFQIETNSLSSKFYFIPQEKGSVLYHASIHKVEKLEYTYDKQKKELIPTEFIDVKGWKAQGNKLEDGKVRALKVISSETIEIKEEVKAAPLKPGDAIEFDF